MLVRGLAVTQAGARCEVALDDASLKSGFHAPDGAVRWTGGDARLDMGNRAGPSLLHVKAYEKPTPVWQRPAAEDSRRSA